MIAWMHISDTQWIRSLAKGSIDATRLGQGSIEFHKFRFEEYYTICPLLIYLHLQDCKDLSPVVRISLEPYTL